MDLYNAYLRLFIYFPLVLFLIYFFLRILLRRLGPSLSIESRISIVERVMISPRVFLLVVRVGDEYFLLSSSATGVTLLKELGSNWQEFLEQTCQNNTAFSPTLNGIFLFLRKIISGKKEKGRKFEEKFIDLTKKLDLEGEMERSKKYFPGKD